MRQNAASAATWTLAAFAVQLIAGVCADMVGKPAGMAAGLSGWAVSIASNLLFLLFYLPLQRGFDEKLYAAHAPEQAHPLGRTWAMATLIQRGASMLGVLPCFQGQDVLSAQQGSFTSLFAVQLVLEMVALIAAIVSYIWMVRYLWRARKLLPKEGTA